MQFYLHGVYIQTKTTVTANKWNNERQGESVQEVLSVLRQRSGGVGEDMGPLGSQRGFCEEVPSMPVSLSEG